MKLPLLLIVMCAFLSACTSSPLPEGYSGPTAIIKDSATTLSSSKADFFYVERVDDRSVENSVVRTRQANHGRGLVMKPQIVERPVPAQPVTLRIAGSTSFAADIQAMFGKSHGLSGTVPFTPKANGNYVVKGQLGEAGCSVWVEEEATGRSIPGTKVSK